MAVISWEQQGTAGSSREQQGVAGNGREQQEIAVGSKETAVSGREQQGDQINTDERITTRRHHDTNLMEKGDFIFDLFIS